MPLVRMACSGPPVPFTSAPGRYAVIGVRYGKGGRWFYIHHATFLREIIQELSEPLNWRGEQCGMDSFMLKWGLIFKALAVTALLLVVRLAIDFAGMDILTVTNLVTAFVGGAIFTIAIILTGT